MEYDIHVYYRDEVEKKEAVKLYNAFRENNITTFPFINRPIGPHPYPMFEAHINDESIRKAEILIENLRERCSILVHEKTGDHIYDHNIGARWFGDKLELDFNFLRSVG